MNSCIHAKLFQFGYVVKSIREEALDRGKKNDMPTISWCEQEMLHPLLGPQTLM